MKELANSSPYALYCLALTCKYMWTVAEDCWKDAYNHLFGYMRITDTSYRQETIYRVTLLERSPVMNAAALLVANYRWNPYVK